nr:transposon Ty3-I Gag-Pol polyprotein [Tanacetum cinerariifolium]
MSKDYDEVHDGESIISIQYHSRAYQNERASCYFIHNPRNDEVSFPKGNCHTSGLYSRRLEGKKIQSEEKSDGEVNRMEGSPQRMTSCSIQLQSRRSLSKQRVLGSKKRKAVMKEVEEWVKAIIVRPVCYLSWIINPVLVKKADDAWRMCIDFINVNSVYLKDYYPLSEIDLEIENAWATYQRLVDLAFQAYLGQNLKAYVDDMVIKSKTEQEMIIDIAETFDNLRMVNMKINPKKCSLRVKEGKFLGYMVTSEGIIADSKKTKALATCNPRKP